jgi:hypothetical protein
VWALGIVSNGGMQDHAVGTPDAASEYYRTYAL